MGDSHAKHLGQALHLACQRESIRGLYLNTSAVPVWNLTVFKTSLQSGYWDEKLGQLLLDYLGQHPGIRYVVISLRWETRLRKERGMDWRTGKVLRHEEERMNFTRNGVGEWCDRLRALGKEVVLLGDTPTFEPPAPLDEWERYRQLELLQHIRPYRERFLTREQHSKGQEFAHEVLGNLAAEGRVHVIDLAPGLMEHGVYPARIGGEFLYSDDKHLTPAGARRAVNQMMPQLLKIMSRADSQPPGEQPPATPQAQSPHLPW